MGDIKLFRYNDDGVTSLESRSATIEKSLQNLIERQMVKKYRKKAQDRNQTTKHFLTA